MNDFADKQDNLLVENDPLRQQQSLRVTGYPRRKKGKKHRLQDNQKQILRGGRFAGCLCLRVGKAEQP